VERRKEDGLSRHLLRFGKDAGVSSEGKAGGRREAGARFVQQRKFVPKKGSYGGSPTHKRIEGSRKGTKKLFWENEERGYEKTCN